MKLQLLGTDRLKCINTKLKDISNNNQIYLQFSVFIYHIRHKTSRRI